VKFNAKHWQICYSVGKSWQFTQGIVCGQIKTTLSVGGHIIVDIFSGALCYRLCNGCGLVGLVFHFIGWQRAGISIGLLIVAGLVEFREIWTAKWPLAVYLGALLILAAGITNCSCTIFAGFALGCIGLSVFIVLNGV